MPHRRRESFVWICLSHMDNCYSSYSVPSVFNNQYVATIKDKENVGIVSATTLRSFTHIFPFSLISYNPVKDV